MPIYEYRCQACNEVSEVFVRGGKEPSTCEKCGEGKLSRLISRAGVIFKGSGFYVNDSKSSNSAGTTSDKSTSDSSSSDSSGSSESKTESKSSESSSKSESSSSSSSSD